MHLHSYPSNQLDDTFLKQIGGVDSNYFINIIDPDIDENDAMNQPQVICYSPYHDFDKLKSILKNSKNQFSIFSTNIRSLGLRLMSSTFLKKVLKILTIPLVQYVFKKPGCKKVKIHPKRRFNHLFEK